MTPMLKRELSNLLDLDRFAFLLLRFVLIFRISSVCHPGAMQSPVAAIDKYRPFAGYRFAVAAHLTIVHNWV